MKSYFLKTSVAIGAAILIVAFQNCSGTKVMFAKIPEEQLFSSSEVSDFQCLQYVEVSLEAVSETKWNIPKRTDEGFCYYVKIAAAIRSQSSKESGMLRDLEITSRDHDLPYADSININNPYIMAKQKLSFLLSDQRKILIAGGASAEDSILVDNFILVGLSPVGIAGEINREYLAYGTSDSSISIDDNKVLLNGDSVELIPFGSGGTSTIKAIALENKMAVGYIFNLDIRLLDAGGQAHMSEIYLVIQ